MAAQTAVASESLTPTGGTILIADDEEIVRALGAAYIERLGFKSLSAADGLEALTLFQEHADEIACVLLDFTMPHMDGVSTFRELRQLQPDARVILCSGYSEQDAVQRFAGQGLSGFLQKPFGLKDLKRQLEQALQDSL